MVWGMTSFIELLAAHRGSSLLGHVASQFVSG